MVPGSARNWIAVNPSSTIQPQQEMKTKHMTTLHLRNSIGRSPLRLGLPRVQPIWIIRGFLLIPLVLAWFALSLTARAVSDPAPDGGYPGANTAEGTDALFSLTGGSNNTANGFDALFSNTGGTNNTAVGFWALYSNTTGDSNTATGHQALYQNTSGIYNTATGGLALVNNTTGFENTATGYDALSTNTTGNFNTATGVDALVNNTTGYENTANGVDALDSNTTGYENTATGQEALYSNTAGYSNTANGDDALGANTTGNHNTANGVNALHNNTTGDSNTANGINALYNNTTGNTNIALGRGAGGSLTTGSSNIDIANPGVAAEANTIRIGTVSSQTNAYVAGIYAATVAKGLTVLVDSTGHLGTKASSERFKDAIKPMDKASEAILALKPVTFHYKKELDPEGVPQFGLVAEEVEKVNPDLVARDADGRIYTVRYEAVNAMLLNEFLKEHRKVQELKSTAAKQEATIAQQQRDFRATAAQQQEEIQALTASLKKQASQIQKVSAQLEIIKPAPQTVLNNQ